MNKQLKIVSLAIILASIVSCKKETQTTVQPDVTPHPKLTTIAGTQKPYDYTQSVEQIISDAGGVVSNTWSVDVFPGRLHETGTGIDDWYCGLTAGICMIVFTEPKHVSLYNDKDFKVSGGTEESPIQVVTANANWPKYHRVSELHGLTSDEGITTVSATPLH